MRLSSTAAAFVLPLLALAEQQQQRPLLGPGDHIKLQFQKYYDLFQPYIPHWNTYDAAHAAAAKAGGANVEVLTLSNWKDTLRNSVTPASSKPEEWWVFITGGNKTCFGHCETANRAFNETALLFAADPTAPHMGYINCEHQPILCNAWAIGPPSLYIMEVTPEPQPVDVRLQRFNGTSVTASDFVKIHTTKSWKEVEPYVGYFHPFDGEVAKYGVGAPIGWFLWIFNVLPNWAFMLLVSMMSRSFMSKRMAPPGTARAPGTARPAGGRVGGATPGDAR